MNPDGKPFPIYQGVTLLKRLLIALAVLAFASFALAACGGSDDSSSTAAATPSSSTSDDDAATGDDDAPPAAAGDGSDATVDISADPSGALAFTKTDITTTAGSDTIDFDNRSSTGHNVEITDADGNTVAETDTITGSKTSTVADLKAGTYTFFCDVPGHREAGMEGTITVK
jgi:plastocyanin